MNASTWHKSELVRDIEAAISAAQSYFPDDGSLAAALDTALRMALTATVDDPYEDDE